MKLMNSRLWGSFNKNGQYEIYSLTEADLEEALDVLNESFFINESVSIACQINLPENKQARKELRNLCRITADDGVSLVAKEVATGQIVGVAFNKIQFVPEKGEEPFFLHFRNNKAQSSQAQGLMDFMITVDDQTDVFSMYNMESVMECMFLATLPAFEGRSIGRTLVKYTIELTKELSQGIGVENLHESLQSRRPQAVTALFTSSFSQKVGASQGFTVLNTVPYTAFHYNGKTFADRLSPLHPNCEHVIYKL